MHKTQKGAWNGGKWIVEKPQVWLQQKNAILISFDLESSMYLMFLRCLPPHFPIQKLYLHLGVTISCFYICSFLLKTHDLNLFLLNVIYISVI